MNSFFLLRNRTPTESIRPIVVASHPRSGTHLTIDFLRRHMPATRARKWPLEGIDTLYLNYGSVAHPKALRAKNIDEALRILARVKRPLIKAHVLPPLSPLPACANPKLNALIDRASCVYVYRDVRKVLCSFHEFQRTFDRRAQVPIHAFIRQKDEHGRSRVAQWARHVREWLAVPGVISLEFDDLIRSPAQQKHRLGRHLDLKADRDDAGLPTSWRSRGESRIKGRLLGVSPHATTIVRTKRIDWRQAFDRQDRAFIQQEAGDLMQELGMESSAAWIESA